MKIKRAKVESPCYAETVSDPGSECRDSDDLDHPEMTSSSESGSSSRSDSSSTTPNKSSSDAPSVAKTVYDDVVCRARAGDDDLSDIEIPRLAAVFVPFLFNKDRSSMYTIGGWPAGRTFVDGEYPKFRDRAA